MRPLKWSDSFPGSCRCQHLLLSLPFQGRVDTFREEGLRTGMCWAWGSMAQEDAGPGVVLRIGGCTQRLEPGAGFFEGATPWAG